MTRDDTADGEAPRWYAAGFNAHGQLDPSTDQDVHELQPLKAKGIDLTDEAELLFASWSQTVLKQSSDLIILGHNATVIPLPFTDIKIAIGTHDKLSYILSQSHDLYTLSPTLTRLTTPSSPKIEHIALTSSQSLALVLTTSKTTIHTFPSSSAFESWYRSPSSQASEPRTHVLPSAITSLKANTATFTALLANGQIWTFGDARYGTLGHSQRETFGLVDALDGMSMRSISAGGWRVGVVSEDGAGYLFGLAGEPGVEGKEIGCLRDLQGGAALVEIVDADGEEVLDVLKLEVGEGHVLALTEGGGVYFVGEGGSGQDCGVSEMGYSVDWTRVVEKGAKDIRACDRSTFIKT